MENISYPLVSIVLPAYNEELAIGKVIDDINMTMRNSGYQYEIIVVDDGSTDKTAEIAKEKGVLVISHPQNRGNGYARRTGIRNAKGEVIVMLDADGTYPANQIPQMLSYLPQYDMVIGARNKDYGKFLLLRKLTKGFIIALAQFITREKIPDLNSGMRVFKKNIAVKFLNILPDTHSWVSTITLAFLCNDYRIKYIPIEYYPRIGRSSFSPIFDTYNYLAMVLRTIMFFKPLKFFLPASFLITLFGLIKLIYDWLIVSDIKESDIMIVLTGIILFTAGILADLTVKEHRFKYIKTEEDKW